MATVRRVRTPEGARFYGAPIGTPIVADKAGKFFAKTAKTAPSSPESPGRLPDSTLLAIAEKVGITPPPMDLDAIRAVKDLGTFNAKRTEVEKQLRALDFDSRLGPDVIKEAAIEPVLEQRTKKKRTPPASTEKVWRQAPSKIGAAYDALFDPADYDAFVESHDQGGGCEDIAAAVEARFGIEQVFGSWTAPSGRREYHSWNAQDGWVLDAAQYVFPDGDGEQVRVYDHPQQYAEDVYREVTQRNDSVDPTVVQSVQTPFEGMSEDGWHDEASWQALQDAVLPQVEAALKQAGVEYGRVSVAGTAKTLTDKETGKKYPMGSVSVGVYGPDGDKIFSMDRRIFPEGKFRNPWGDKGFNPTPVVINDGFWVGRSYQGQGIAAALTPRLEDLWRSWGIQQVQVAAGADVGGYAWARLGFEFASPEEGAKVAHLVGRVASMEKPPRSLSHPEQWEAHARAAQDDLAALREKYGPDFKGVHPVELAMVGYRPGDDWWVGKHGLLGTSWEGVKRLDTDSVHALSTRKLAASLMAAVVGVSGATEEHPQLHIEVPGHEQATISAQAFKHQRKQGAILAQRTKRTHPRGAWKPAKGAEGDEVFLRNESGDIIASEVPLTGRQVELLVSDFDFVLSKVPPGAFEAMHPKFVGVRVVQDMDPTVDGYVIMGIPVIHLNPDALERLEPEPEFAWPWGLAPHDSVRGILAHEMGHVIDVPRFNLKEQFWGHASDANPNWEADAKRAGLSDDHVGSAPHEFFAEMFAYWAMGFDPEWAPRKEIAQEYAQRYGWGKVKKRAEKIAKGEKVETLALSRADEVKAKISGVQKAKDTLTDIDVDLRAGVRERIQQAVDTYFGYARAIGINNPMLSPAEIFSRPDVQALWGQEAASLDSWLANRLSEGWSKGVALGRSGANVGQLDSRYLDSVIRDLHGYVYSIDAQVQGAVWDAYAKTPWVPSYQQGGTSTNVPRDTAVARWRAAQDNQSAVVTDISRRAHAGIGSVTQRGYTEGQFATVTDTSMLKMWVANFAQDPKRGPCLTCIALHGTTIPVTEQFPAHVTYAKKPLGVYRDLMGPPRHAHCKCKLVFFAAHEDPGPVAKTMNDYAMDHVASTMASQGFTAAQVRSLPEPLFERLWRFLVRGGWWQRLWRRLRSG